MDDPLAPALRLLLIGPGALLGTRGKRQRTCRPNSHWSWERTKIPQEGRGELRRCLRSPRRVQFLTFSRNQWEGSALPIGRLRAHRDDW